MKPEQVAERTVRAQYGPGTIDGEKVKGYKEEEGVRKDSQTETYAAVEFHISNWRWSGVPFYVRTGKRLARNLTEIASTPETHAAGVVYAGLTKRWIRT